MIHPEENRAHLRALQDLEVGVLINPRDVLQRHAIDAVRKHELGRKQADDQVRLAGKIEEIARMRQHTHLIHQADDEIFFRTK